MVPRYTLPVTVPAGWALPICQRLTESHLNYRAVRFFRSALTVQTSSARPIKKAKKQSTNTEWLRLAPKYCQKAA